MTSAVVQGSVKERLTPAFWRVMDRIERKRALRMLVCFLAPFTIITVCSIVGDSGLIANVESRYQRPSVNWPLGTDWLGRGMCTRVLLGLRLSLWVGFRDSLGWLRKLADEGKAVLLISHDVAASLVVADRVAVVHDSRVIEVASAAAFSGQEIGAIVACS